MRGRTSLLYIIICFCLVPFNISYSQSLKFEKKIILPFHAKNGSIDKNGNLYLASEKGTIFKYNENGDSLLAHSPKYNSPVTLIEAAWGLKIFVFYGDYQEYLFLDRFLRPSPSYTFNQELISNALIATIGNDENLWVIDPIDFAIKKYNPKSNIVELSTPLDLVLSTDDYDITFIKEHKNQLFIADANSGLLVFDNMGNNLKNLPVRDIHYFGFIGNKLFFQNSDDIVLFGLSDGSSTVLTPKEIEEIDIDFTIASSTKIYVVEDNQLLIYRIEE